METTTGDRYFCANHEGVTFYTTEAAFALNNSDCNITVSFPGAQPVILTCVAYHSDAQ